MNVGKLIKGYIAVILSAVLYGCMPLMAKYIYAEGVNPMTLVFLRNFVALPVIAAMAYGQCKTLKIPMKLLGSVSFTALFGSCITPVLLFASYLYIDGGTATVIHFIYPAIVVLASFLLKKDKPNWGNVTSVILCFGGICLFYNPGAPLDWRGLVLAAVSGFPYATYVLLAAPFMASNFVMNQCLRSEGSAILSMIGMGFGGVLNCALDPIFIFGLDMGVAGASLATAISKVVSFLILI